MIMSVNILCFCFRTIIYLDVVTALLHFITDRLYFEIGTSTCALY